jgi:hypothetical protein
MDEPRIDVKIPIENMARIREAANKAGFVTIRAFIRTLLIKKFPAKKAAA